MAKNKNIQKSERESLNIKDRLFETLKTSMPEAFSEGKVNWDKLRRALGEHLDTSADKFNFTWAGKAQAITNVLIPSKATLRPDKKESVKFDESENLFIEGDNLEVLKLLQKSYFEQVKMIYIDPPYNTGNDFVYKDDFKSPLKNYLEQSGQVDSEGNRLSTNTQASGRFHSDWLSMMYPRLKLAWNLLRHDGIIFISIDDNEVSHLRMLMNEIFGEENFLALMVWRKKAGGDAGANYFYVEQEYILAFAKDISQIPKLHQKLTDEQLKEYKNPDNDPRGLWKPVDYSAPTTNNNPNQMYTITVPSGKKYTKRWSNIKEKFEQLLKDNRIWFGKDGNSPPRRKTFLNEKDGMTPRTLIYNLCLNSKGNDEMEEIFNAKVFDFPKPNKLIKHLISIVSDNKQDDIILDFFAGSGTAAHAVLIQNQEDEGNRKFILVQMPEPIDSKSDIYKAGYKTIADIAKERIRRVLKGYGDHKAIDDGFKVFKLDKSNYYDNLFEYDPEKSNEENEKAFQDYLNKAQKELFPAKINEIDIVYESIIKEGLNLNAKIEETKIGQNKVYKVADSERELFICLDEKLSDSAIGALTAKEYKEKIFICFDGALTDSDKANLALNLTLKTI